MWWQIRSLTLNHLERPSIGLMVVGMVASPNGIDSILLGPAASR
jgi:hypothetical protein